MSLQSPFRAVLFDLDGTLLDTAPDLGGAANRLLERDNLPLLSRKVINQTASQGSLALVKAGYGLDLEEAQYQQLRSEFLENYTAHVNDETTYFDGIDTLLDALDRHNIVWGIVTNKPTLYTQQLLEHYPRLASCAVVVCGDTLDVAKPNPAPLLLAANNINIAPENIVYVGDARTDIEAAHSASMLAVAANYGYIPSDDPADTWQGDHIIDRPEDLLAVLGI
ncbi:HAD-IA family hydrolase [Psychrobium sp. MM17-31]|uniref:HAD family hydrolase n=1 Tax=Psychrobium sp. MM17-31 TaxID=2917758 RepID=UPI001EF64460|nr:HAD-IA family hydrolase [Psychrobium sp. MM17-31]MCG7531840.1 HAD-IA family hydrolase [Psychrobium sp. MM17-31]